MLQLIFFLYKCKQAISNHKPETLSSVNFIHKILKTLLLSECFKPDAPIPKSWIYLHRNFLVVPLKPGSTCTHPIPHSRYSTQTYRSWIQWWSKMSRLVVWRGEWLDKEFWRPVQIFRTPQVILNIRH